MPITIKHRDKLPTTEYETVDVSLDLEPIALDLKIPKRSSLPMVLSNQLIELQTKLYEDQISHVDFFMRAFCLFTQSLPSHERLNYTDLKSISFPETTKGIQEQMQLLTTIMTSTTELMNALSMMRPADGDEGKAKVKKPAN